MPSGYDCVKDYLFVIGFDEQDNGVFSRRHRKADGRIEFQLVTLDKDGRVIDGELPPFRRTTRTFKQR